MAKGNRLSRDVVLVGDVLPDKGSIQKVLIGTIARTDTTAKQLGILPAGAVVIGLTVYSPAASNAATTAVIKLGYASGTGTEILPTYDVKTAGTGAGQTTPNAAVLNNANAAAQTITGIYAETGAASSAGGPWFVCLEYYTV